MSEEKDRVDGTADETKAETKSSDHHTEDTYEKVCFMCRRPESKAGKMITLPGNINICPDCMQKSFDAMNQNPGQINEMMNNMNNMPNIGMFDLSGLSNQIPNRQRVKKKEEKKKTKEFSIKDIPPPHRIKAMLDEYVIGQERAKKVMSVAVYNHYKRVFAPQDGNIEIEKSNMLMIGPTGSGKTYLVQTLARLLDVPLAITDATSLTEAGYIGDDIESVVSKLLAAADNDVERAEHGIIFIDEIDKIAKKKNTNQRDVSGEAVQQGMLKLLEGSDIEVPVGANSKNAMVPLETVNTRNILFICGGAFDGLDKIIEARTDRSTIGFDAPVESRKNKDVGKLLAQVEPHDLMKFGIIPELIGRMPMISCLESLTKDDLVRIMVEPKNAIARQYQKLLEMDGVALEITDEALNAIAQKAIDRQIGARGLRAIMEKVMTGIMFRIPSDLTIQKVVLTPECIDGGEPQIIRDPQHPRQPLNGKK